tara:strand:- start:2518 stop:3315 length:798 start_codon:yes stop_codon:yes gene_type:complete
MPNSMLISTLRKEVASISKAQPSTKLNWMYATRGIDHIPAEEFTKEDAQKHRRLMRETLSDRTLKCRLGDLSTIWNWGIDEGRIDFNPWANMGKRIKVEAKEHPELPFAHFSKFHDHPLFMAIWYHGFRVSEIANISSEEIVLDAEIPYFRLRHNSVRRLKNHSSKRDIPIYKGYLPFVIDGQLVLDNQNPRAGDNFSRSLKHHTGVSAHSIRHQFRSRMSDADIEYSTQMALMGHLGEGMTAKYGKVKLKTKKKALSKVNKIIE